MSSLVEKKAKFYDPDLTDLILSSTNENLDPLVKYIVDKGGINETLTNNIDFKMSRPDHVKYAYAINDEIICYGSHSLLGARSYIDIVKKVASKLKVDFLKNDSVNQLEERILIHLLGDAYEKMPDEDRKVILNSIGYQGNDIPKVLPVLLVQAILKASGFVAYQLAVIVANIVARCVIGSGLVMAGNVLVARGMAVFLGPVGWTLSLGWLAADLGGIAYRVCIPSVVHIAMLRKKQKYETAAKCTCGNTLSADMKFCPQCGKEIQF